MENSHNGININIKALQNILKSSEDADFLSKYDKDKNSIFSKEEIAELSDDLIKFASKDGKADTLSAKEALDFYNYTMSKNDKNFKPIKSFEDNKNPVLDWLQSVNKTFELNNMFQTEFGRDFGEDIKLFMEMDDKRLQTVKKLLSMDKDKRLQGIHLAILSRANEEKLQKIEKLMKMDGLNRGFDLGILYDKLSNLTEEQINLLPKLINIPDRNLSLSMNELFFAAQLPEDYLNNLLKTNPNFSISKSTATRFEINENPGEQNVSKVFDTEAKEWIETITREHNGNLFIKTIENKKLNVKQVVKSDEETGQLISLTNYKYDKEGNLISKEEFVPGTGGIEQNISITDKNGKKYPVQWSEYDEATGTRTTQKSLISPDGTKTDYFLEETADGLNISEYVIKDKNGNILLNEKRTFQPVNGNPNKFISSVNDKIYEIEYQGNFVSVKDKSNNQETKIDLSKLTDTNSPDIMKIIKQMPGDKLIQLSTHPINKIQIDDIMPTWDPFDKILNMRSIEFASNEKEVFGIFMHEFGHFLDTKLDSSDTGVLSEDSELIKTFREEFENYKQNSTTFDRKIVDHILQYYENPDVNLIETVAESSLLLYSEYTSMRAYILQKNFPKTIARVAQLTEQMNTN